jgi:hypothetical protein
MPDGTPLPPQTPFLGIKTPLNESPYEKYA